MLCFTPISQHKPGTLAHILRKAYAGILASDPQYWQVETQNWEQFDREAFENPETIGKCVFITTLDNASIGFGSFDPRQKPVLGIIGHNCILPEFRNAGYGKQQIDELVLRLKALAIRRVEVTTSEHPFFLPAQRMYLACGFHERRRYAGGPDPRYRIIEFDRDI
jgi:GNAT superfamily N-acetyltransferase